MDDQIINSNKIKTIDWEEQMRNDYHNHH